MTRQLLTTKLNKMILTKNKIKRMSTDNSGELGIMCFTSSEKWNKLYSVDFTLRSDFDNVLLESLFQDKSGSELFKGVDFKFGLNGYSFTEEYINTFDLVDSEFHIESKKGWDSFNKFLTNVFPDDVDESWNKKEYEKYTSGLSKDGHLYEMDYSRKYKTFVFSTDTQFKKLSDSVDGLKINPIDNPSLRLFEYSIGLISFKDEKIFFLDEWIDAMILIS
jgi:hypothetical protein